MSNTYDYVIVGSGTAGSVIAYRLSEMADAQILLLEAGGTNIPDAVDQRASVE